MNALDCDPHEEDADGHLAPDRCEAIGYLAEPPVLCHLSGSIRKTYFSIPTFMATTRSCADRSANRFPVPYKLPPIIHPENMA